MVTVVVKDIAVFWREPEKITFHIFDDDGQQQQQQTEQSTIRRGGGEGRIREELVWNLEREREAHKRQSAAIFYDWHQDTRKRERRTKNKRRAACTHIYRGRERGGWRAVTLDRKIVGRKFAIETGGGDRRSGRSRKRYGCPPPPCAFSRLGLT